MTPTKRKHRELRTKAGQYLAEHKLDKELEGVLFQIICYYGDWKLYSELETLLKQRGIV